MTCLCFLLFRWLSPLILLLDTHEKMAVTTKRKHLHDKVTCMLFVYVLIPVKF